MMIEIVHFLVSNKAINIVRFVIYILYKYLDGIYTQIPYIVYQLIQRFRKLT